jgi:hypothetical protein
MINKLLDRETKKFSELDAEEITVCSGKPDNFRKFKDR